MTAIKHKELDKCINDTIAFTVDHCVETALDFCLKLIGEERKDNKSKVLEYNLHLYAHNGIGFNTWVVLNNFLVIKE